MDILNSIWNLIIQNPFVTFIVLVALVFDFTNGMHDSANSIATLVSTRVLSPKYAVLWATFFNFLAIFIIGTAVAKTIGSWMINTNLITPMVILCWLFWAILWNIITWLFGLPTSSSHALLGWYLWSAIAKWWFASIIYSGWTKTIIFIFLAPLIWMVLWIFLLIGTTWLIHIAHKRFILPPLWLLLLGLSYVVFLWSKPVWIVLILMVLMVFVWLFIFWNKLKSISNLSRYMQLLSSALYSIGHGWNDAQKTMGIIVSLLLTTHLTTSAEPPLWVIILAYSAIGLWTMAGWWKIIKTMWSNIVKLRPIDGFCASWAWAVSLFTASHFWVPVSTTQAIAWAISWVWMAKSLRSVHWGVAWNIFMGWIFTIPSAAIIAFVMYKIGSNFIA